MNSPDGTGSGGGVEETLKAIMKHLDAAIGTVTWDLIRRRAAREEGGGAQTSRRTARAEGGRALSRRRANREEGGGTFTEPPPTVIGVEGIMSAYSTTLYSVALAGPTLFGPIINKAAGIASESLQYGNNKYFVLLIITDGVLTDIQETKDSIVRASDLPLSILIVGVGNADFKQMEILDGDSGKRLESSTGRISTRDIVQFVPMREVQGGQISVVQSLLEELPGQFLAYMRSRDIKPRAPPHNNASASVYPPPPDHPRETSTS
ncbi:hypothetical protein GUJ93_ZPchr0010g9457 [Zizania palustris]|uniref:Copine C-terminal domain-containing protein n=1 Tax=Zizania palustris TaxID=103762 RepID=A0A8J6BDV5_ZIZPA|nr:hypothetical protein GUJ93_ZPchr0010g9457 [Zizania palustris]